MKFFSVAILLTIAWITGCYAPDEASAEYHVIQDASEPKSLTISALAGKPISGTWFASGDGVDTTSWIIPVVGIGNADHVFSIGVSLRDNFGAPAKVTVIASVPGQVVTQIATQNSNGSGTTQSLSFGLDRILNPFETLAVKISSTTSIMIHANSVMVTFQNVP